MIANRSVPSSTIIPELPYDDVAQACYWLCRAFGFRERLRIVRVADADRHHEQAKRSGARILQPPADHPYGERQYTAEDLGGHVWTFSQSIADVDPASWGGTLR
jgi:uncharacterized glyoxalase superfamily protein PhnB